MTSKVIGQPELDGEIVKLVVRMHSGEGREGPLPELADVYAWLADMIRRIEGTDVEKRGGVSADAFHYLAEMLSDSHPKASKYMTALADWLLTDDGDDFTPPGEADAIAAAEKRGERRGVEREREAAAKWLEKRPNTFEHTPQWYANRLRIGSHLDQYIKDGVHLNGGESDDS